ncbi:MAG: AI-2E family transporter [Melioribacteraceae bacterium]|nr:AI-2E family transporter [Melioribacteraceae bacterium]MCF8356768.1 AI-2E family transporter [Melioribacteraceae bacterium]MCF8396130.1 AI-2E family transporter [Melioribacteraceae bacterium]MCF8421104.1 AI-2E family transporter [Melioribacteraceae bacterium]
MKRQLGDPVIKFFISVVGIVLIVLVLKELQHIFIPFVLAYLLFFIFEPLNSFLKKHKIPSGVSTVIDITIIASIFWGISRVIITSFTQFGEEMPIYESRLNNIVGSTFKSMGITDPALINFNLSEILQNLDYGGLASGFFTSTISLFSTVFFILFFFIFISSGHAKIYEAIKRRYVESNVKSSVKQIRKQLKTEVSEEDTDDLDAKLSEMKLYREATVEQTFRVITEQIQRYIATKFLISLTTGVLVGIVLWIFGVDFVIVWAFLTTMLNFIPNIGSAIAVILPTLMTLVQFESFGYTLLIGGIIAVIQNVIGNIIEPKIFGDRLGLNPIVILISLLVWGYIWGIVGMFLSVPLTAVIKIIISNSKSKNLKFISDLMAN